MKKSSGNVTSPHSQLSIIPIRLACEMYTYCNILELSRWEQFGGWKKELGKFDDKCFCVGRSYDQKMSHFSLRRREDENGGEMNKNEKRSFEACKATFFDRLHL